MPELTPATALTTWRPDLPVTVVLVALLAGYLAAWLRVRRTGAPWSGYRAAAFVLLGVGSVVVLTMGFLAAYADTVAWCLPVELTLLITISPLCLALGDPLGLVRAGLGERGRRRWDAVWASPPVRLVTFPVVAAVLASATLVVVFFTGYLRAALASDSVMSLLELQVLATGLLLALPLLGVEVLPPWVGDGLKLLFASADGLLDAVPGLFVMTWGSLLAGGWYARFGSRAHALHEQHVGGVLMLCLSEVVAIPMLGVLFARWVRSDLRAARDRDAELDRIESGRESVGEPEMLKPWWEQ